MLARTVLLLSYFLLNNLGFRKIRAPESSPTDYDIEEMIVSDELAMTQLEWREQGQLAYFGLGESLPWQDYSLGYSWQASDALWGINVGKGKFTLSSYQQGKALFSDASIISAWLSYLKHIKNYPLFFDSFFGINSWSSELRLRANEINPPINNLLSDGSIQSAAFGVRLGFVWHFTNGIYTDVTLGQFSKAWILKQSLLKMALYPRNCS